MTAIADELFDRAQAVRTRSDFVSFIEYLNANSHVCRAEWENDDLGSFLSGLAGFAHDIHGFYKNMGESVDVEKPSWRMFAQMILAATVYGN